MVQKPAIEGLDCEFPSGTEGKPELQNGNERALAHLYEYQMSLSRDVMRLHDEVERLRRDREGFDEEVDEVPDVSGRRALPIRITEWPRHHPVSALLSAILTIIAFTASNRALAYFDSYQSTDDAEVDAHIDPLSARISGTVLQVYAEDNDHVKAGQLLAVIDPRDYQIAVEQARANYDQACALTDISVKDYKMAVARVNAARAVDLKAQRDAGRYTILSHQGVASAEEFDQASVTAKVGSATLAEESAAAESAAEQHAAHEASAAAAKAIFDQALLNLSYTKIVSPIAGIIGKRSVEVGQHIDPGEELLAIVRNDDLWVTANFKETQLGRMYGREPASIHVDTFGTDYQGYVESLSGASGAKYSFLPPENATGNYIKIVQRIPVRIRLLGQQSIDLLRPGMSVEVTVWLK
ncbi:MAG TPA: HlyD family secretion protein [Candidatus Binataceae bacterium]|jgi:membrane fusion protein (multidrug efflux system)|nr:HlyD family secretion protein [Candidatus Binataceae bacterium]